MRYENPSLIKVNHFTVSGCFSGSYAGGVAQAWMQCNDGNTTKNVCGDAGAAVKFGNLDSCAAGDKDGYPYVRLSCNVGTQYGDKTACKTGTDAE